MSMSYSTWNSNLKMSELRILARHSNACGMLCYILLIEVRREPHVSVLWSFQRFEKRFALRMFQILEIAETDVEL